ncbi:MAG: hypothetical protein FJ143_14495 [Deltaproteobacteria bacterium]|nr:hypothetical protein [Deltaproteobacteria bacterium]
MLLRNCHRTGVLALSFLIALLRQVSHGVAAESGLVAPSGLEKSVEFWQQVFGKYDSKTVLFFDPFDQATIYSTLKISDSPAGRAALEKERRRVLADHDLDEEMGRLRTQRGAKDQFLAGLRAGGRYLPEMKKIFRDQELPTDLAYLPLVESFFNLRARSPVGAAGIWQFMPETGRKFLRIDNTVDERLDPIASTRAAAKLLKENYQILGSWPLAITAYNHGTEGLFRAIQVTGSRNLVDIIRRYKSDRFGFASQNFYAEFLAVVYLAKNSERYFPFLRMQPPLVLREWTVSHTTSVEAMLKPAAITAKDFYGWNPALAPGLKQLAAGQRINLPADKYDSFIIAQRRAADSRKEKKPTVVVAAPATAASKPASAKAPAKVRLAAAKPSKVSKAAA